MVPGLHPLRALCRVPYFCRRGRKRIDAVHYGGQGSASKVDDSDCFSPQGFLRRRLPPSAVAKLQGETATHKFEEPVADDAGGRKPSRLRRLFEPVPRVET